MGDVAGVIGISGDIEALQNGDFSDGSDPFHLHGFAYYFVYAEQLSDTSYDVLNWIEDLGQSEDDLQDFSFAFVNHFPERRRVYYLSKDGSITVNGGTMQFNGNYYSIEGVGFFDDDEEDASYSVVSGYGAMGCN